MPGHRTDVSSVGNAKQNHAEDLLGLEVLSIGNVQNWQAKEVRRADKQSKGIAK